MSPAMDIVRTLTLISSAALAVAMVGLCVQYARRRDWRALLAFGYALGMAYIVAAQAEFADSHWNWRTLLALASSMVGWAGVQRAMSEWG
jgi:heme/copper-type cytochrome/quinol oxidase subunit 3